jgi:hypothetical protein
MRTWPAYDQPSQEPAQICKANAKPNQAAIMQPMADAKT